VEAPSLDFVGWAWQEDLIKAENIINLGHGEGYALDQDKLKQF
jgi:hypothetical protein